MNKKTTGYKNKFKKYHVTFTSLFKKTRITRVGEDVEKEALLHCWWESNSHYNSVEVPQKIRNTI